MTIQFLYDLREATGFISGNELHALLQSLYGDMSPSGNLPLLPDVRAKGGGIASDIQWWVELGQLHPGLAAELASPAWLNHAASYMGVTPDQLGQNVPAHLRSCALNKMLPSTAASAVEAVIVTARL